jgi:hypothetical protein
MATIDYTRVIPSTRESRPRSARWRAFRSNVPGVVLRVVSIALFLLVWSVFSLLPWAVQVPSPADVLNSALHLDATEYIAAITNPRMTRDALSQRSWMVPQQASTDRDNVRIELGRHANPRLIRPLGSPVGGTREHFRPSATLCRCFALFGMRSDLESHFKE